MSASPFIQKPDIKISVKQTFGIDSKMEINAFEKKNEFVPKIDPYYKFDRDTTLAVLAGFVFAAVLVWFFSPFIAERVNVIPTAIYEYFVNGQIADGSAGTRLAFWHAAALIFWENPLFGTGPGTYYVEKLKLIEAGLIPQGLRCILAPIVSSLIVYMNKALLVR